MLTKEQVIESLPQIIESINNGNIEMIDGCDDVLSDKGKADVAIITVGDKQFILQVWHNMSEFPRVRNVFHISGQWIGSLSPRGKVDSTNEGVTEEAVDIIADWCSENVD